MVVNTSGFERNPVLTVAGLVTHASAQAAGVEAAGRDYDAWANSRPGASRALFSRDRFNRSVQAADRLKAFVGPKRYSEYVAMWNQGGR